MFEHYREPIIPREKFATRFAAHLAIALAVVAVSLSIGIMGYHYFENLSWIDATVNAAMILGGMGPLSPLKTDGGKLFAAAYALFSGLVFLIAVAILFAPLFHRFLHHFHLEMDEGKTTS